MKSHHRSGHLGTIAKAAMVLTSLYVVFVVYSVTRPSSAHLPSLKRSSNSPHRKTLERKPTFFKKVSHINYRDSLAELLAEPAPHYVLFTSGTIDGSPDGQPWCGDCFAAGPVVRDLLSRAGGALLEVNVGSPEEWHKEDHPVRVDREAPVKYIPTLYHWSTIGPGARISSQLNAQTKEPQLKEIVAKFLKETAGQVRSVVSLTQQILEKKGKKCSHC